MKKLSLYIFLVLMFCNVGFADYFKLNEVQLIMSNECGSDLQIKKYRQDDRYFFHIENWGAKTVVITKIELVNEKDEVMRSSTLDLSVNAFHKRKNKLSAVGLIHELLKKIVITCTLQ